ncbi:hypothetical protein QTP88_010126 [Uroleucon formosanum]
MDEHIISNYLNNMSDWSGDDTDDDDDFSLVNDEDDSIPNTDEVASITIQNNNQNLEPVWNDVDDAFQPRVLFNQTNETVGINPDIIDCLSEGTPFDFYSLFLDDEIIQLLVEETNRYAAELLKSVVSPHSHLKQWENVTRTEMKKFLGIIMWMGLCPKPSIASYWKTNNIIYISNIPKFMKRKRFELLLRTFNCSNNALCPPGDKLLDLLLSKFKMARAPKQSMCIDESMIPFTGRLSFKQYIQNKTHKYGIKLFKLCIDNFYTVGIKIYAGKEATVGQRVSTKVVMEMAEDYLDLGRTMFTDNCKPSKATRNESNNQSNFKILFYEIIDNILMQLNTRFQDTNKLLFLQLADVTKFKEYSCTFPVNALNNLKSTYPNIFYNINSLKVELEVLYSDVKYQNLLHIYDMVKIIEQDALKDILPEAYKLFILILTIPSTSVSNERSFSCLKRIKTCSRNSISQVRFSSLSILSIEKSLINHLKKTESFYDDIINISTNLVGTLRSNRKNNPKEVVNKKLKKGEVIAKQCNKGITVLKWKDKREVLMISTKHSDAQSTIINKRGKEVIKPQVIIDYNIGKGLVDVTDLRNSYHNPLRKTVKWYKKVVFELLLNTSVLNALSSYEEIRQEKMDITVFREMLVISLLKSR